MESIEYKTYPSEGFAKRDTLLALGVEVKTRYDKHDVPCQSKFVIHAFPKTELEKFAILGVLS